MVMSLTAEKLRQQRRKAILYWMSKGELGQEIVMHPDIDWDDLIRFMPNNKKKMLGIPMSSWADSRNKKRKNKYRFYKRKLQRIIFECSTKVIDKEYTTRTRDICINLAEVKEIIFGDKVIFNGQNHSYFCAR